MLYYCLIKKKEKKKNSLDSNMLLAYTSRKHTYIILTPLNPTFI